MAAFSKTAPSGTSDLDLLGVDRNNFQVCSDHKKVELAPSGFAASGLEHNSRFKNIGSRDQALSSLKNQVQKCRALSLGQKNGQQS